jgi:hypothetical protein
MVTFGFRVHIFADLVCKTTLIYGVCVNALPYLCQSFDFITCLLSSLIVSRERLVFYLISSNVFNPVLMWFVSRVLLVFVSILVIREVRSLVCQEDNVAVRLNCVALSCQMAVG